MLYSSTHTATVGVKGLNIINSKKNTSSELTPFFGIIIFLEHPTSDIYTQATYVRGILLLEAANVLTCAVHLFLLTSIAASGN